MKVWTPEIEDFRESMGLDKSVYRLKNTETTCIKDLKGRVIEPSVDKINEVTELNIGFEKGNNGRTWRKIRFTILDKPKNSENNPKPVREADPYDIWWDEAKKPQNTRKLCELYSEFKQISLDEAISLIYDNPSAIPEKERIELFHLRKQQKLKI
jgi:plasmid replication initiation protein